ncbi:CPBP family intramembrane glutamic endopeptidase [Cryptosporangium phraense]|uniref:CPBP family intramembrane metalloprotease n=1 Tax=Cryptosporangium phraense TaxID=2593070 RepID=A0A545AUU0_9ACTN|nr:CPBP family intramembrane glutamic endopeptidase [Cryptosporangium phraense]TQS45041.1 CPBP family intramembrane metalloprotease [Cryptosporangium phraense]
MKTLVNRYPLISFFALAFGLSWIAWTPFVLSDHGLGLEPEFRFPSGPVAQLVGVLPGAYLGPLAAAFIVTSLAEGRAGLRHWAGRLLRWRVSLKWYLIVLLGTPLVILVASLALPGAWEQIRVPSLMILAAYVPMLLVQFVTTAAAEEPGWRDFALPRLQRRYGPVFGTCVLGVLWGCWHLPLFFTEWGGYPDVTWVQPVVFVASCVPLSLVMTWVFNRTGQSLPLVMLLHASINATYSLVWAEVFPKLDLDRDTLWGNLIGSVAVAAILIVATRGKLGLSTTEEPADRPALAASPA